MEKTPHEFWMQRCIQLALKGKEHVAPNPMVGCVIVHDNKIIGEGYHQQFGAAHAEVNAIQSLRDDNLIPNATLYVSLEPCTHYGKTPPCADLIIKKGFKKVVIGTIDCHEKVCGKGIEKLQKHGVEVTLGVLEKECKALNKYFFEASQFRKPYYLLKWAQTKDGFIYSPNHPPQISNELSAQKTHQIRAEYQGILIGKNTALVDDPTLNVRLVEGKDPIRIVLMHKWDPVLEKLTLYQDDAPTLFFNTTLNEKRGEKHLIKLPKENALDFVNHWLVDNGINSVLVEGGTTVLNNFLKENSWNEMIINQSLITFGEGTKAPAIKATPEHSEKVGDDTWSYYINRR